MTGRRVYEDTPPHLYEPGDYGRHHGEWWCRAPVNADGVSYPGRLLTHRVEEHEDRTISVSPSILNAYGDGEQVWHGYLERGVWRAC